jgi:soluble lytic murein transglycosylase-like protein
MTRPVLCCAAVLAALCSPLGAEIVVLTNGHTIASTTHRTEGDETLLTLAGGGEVRVPASQIAQVLADEIVPQEEPSAAVAPRDHAEGPAEWLALATDMAHRHRIDAGLVAAVIAVESGFQPSAVSPKGAMGLMQLMPSTAAQLGVVNPFDPHQNIDGGVRHLRALLTRYQGDRRLALAAYNAGVAAVELHGGVPPFSETRAYVRKVLARSRRVRQ